MKKPKQRKDKQVKALNGKFGDLDGSRKRQNVGLVRHQKVQETRDVVCLQFPFHLETLSLLCIFFKLGLQFFIRLPCAETLRELSREKVDVFVELVKRCFLVDVKVHFNN